MITSRQSRRGLGGLAVALPLTLAIAAGAAAAPPDHAKNDDRADTAAHPDQGNHGKPPELEARAKPIIKVTGRTFKDLNANGRLDPYEDWRRPASERVQDLVGQMTLAEKAGLMLIDTLNAACNPATGERGTVPAAAANFIGTQQMHRFIFRNTSSRARSWRPRRGSRQHDSHPGGGGGFTNSVQAMSEATRLGIPVAVQVERTQPHRPGRPGRHQRGAPGAITAFPKEAGLAAAALGERDPRRTGQRRPPWRHVRRSRTSPASWARSGSPIGLRGMYGYMADLSTEPRWYRSHETFTEDADLNADIMRTLVENPPGPGQPGRVSLTPECRSRSTMKHFPGGGPQELGLDPHYSFGKTQVYPGDEFGYHLKPFEAAINAGVSAIMPYYGVPMDVDLQGHHLRRRSAWRSRRRSSTACCVTSSASRATSTPTPASSTTGRGGSRGDRAAARRRRDQRRNRHALGLQRRETIIDLLTSGLVTEERVTLAAQRLLEPLFQLGLFEDPYVDEAAATATVGSTEHDEVALELQRQSRRCCRTRRRPTAQRPAAQGGLEGLRPGRSTRETAAGYGYHVVDGNARTRAAAGRAPPAATTSSSSSRREHQHRRYDSRSRADAPTNPIVAGGCRGPRRAEPLRASRRLRLVRSRQLHRQRPALRRVPAVGVEHPRLHRHGRVAVVAGDTVAGHHPAGHDRGRRPQKVVLHVYFRQPFVLDEASGLRNAGAIVAGFGISDTALMDVLSGPVRPAGQDALRARGDPGGDRAAVQRPSGVRRDDGWRALPVRSRTELQKVGAGPKPAPEDGLGK